MLDATTVGIAFILPSFLMVLALSAVYVRYGGVVQGHHWLTDHQFVDAVAVAMITPGPVVITVAFIGYLFAGAAGATVAALGIFLPVYLVVVLLAPSYKRWSKKSSAKCFRPRCYRSSHWGNCRCCCGLFAGRFTTSLPS